MRLIVGLGNPGREYERSRHNVGFRCLDEVARRLGLRFSRRAFDSLVTTGILAGEKVLLVKPQTYMNLSGKAVGRALRYHGLGSEDLLVVCDDIDLPFGKIRLRPRGSSAGHRGVQSIIDEIGTNE
ncbi:MAG: aminoacyl-tRNA hydrolase, partial [Chloroflexota bacterium]